MGSEEEIREKIKEIEFNLNEFYETGTRAQECLSLGVKYLKWVLEDD